MVAAAWSADVAGDAADVAAVEALLAAHDLPVEGVAALGDGLLVLRDADGAIVAAAGVEPLTDCGLLRSVVVVGHAQGQGLGARMVEAVEARAAAMGLQSLWLLTSTASNYFARLGYTVAERDAAPAALRATQEFATLCLQSAVLMRKQVSPGNGD